MFYEIIETYVVRYQVVILRVNKQLRASIFLSFETLKGVVGVLVFTQQELMCDDLKLYSLAVRLNVSFQTINTSKSQIAERNNVISNDKEILYNKLPSNIVVNALYKLVTLRLPGAESKTTPFSQNKIPFCCFFPKPK